MLIRSEFCTDFLLAVSVSMGNTWWQSGGYCFEYFLKKSWKYEKNGLTWKGYSSWNWICVVVLSAQGTYSKRKRRAAPTRIRCRLALVADYRFFTEMGRGDTKQTINYMVSQNSYRHKNHFWFFKKCNLIVLWKNDDTDVDVNMIESLLENKMVKRKIRKSFQYFNLLGQDLNICCSIQANVWFEEQETRGIILKI